MMLADDFKVFCYPFIGGISAQEAENDLFYREKIILIPGLQLTALKTEKAIKKALIQIDANHHLGPSHFSDSSNDFG
jgi:hypothetical protein